MMKKFKIEDSIFPHPLMFILFIAYWSACVFLLSFIEQGDVVLWVNFFSNNWLDHFFLYATFLGNGFFAAIVAFVFLFRKVYYSISMLFTFVLVSIFTNLFKRLVFIQHYRPLWFLYYNDLHRVIYDAPVNYLRSFPSGHTMTAFALATVLSILFRKKGWAIVFFIGALIVAWSRVYLCQHFFIDIFWGGVLGFLSAILGVLITNYFVSSFNINSWNLPIQKILPSLVSRFRC